ncbi:class I lanthipeptide [Christiangramia sp. SM2212]|jgi:hypothetical protein|uniref:Class I lanthipeptide n=1 Tax=Christiangramia sediminicola TaxID=3073267 RepID=A0ABU1ET19_9FLAO|nr:class I lanthipeptide [Christiangramia sp. SM2212]MDR5591114.1 class I lanthipeptide [Christiangramia sp. SM2212]
MKKHLKSKLKLNKETIGKLQPEEMQNIKGGKEAAVTMVNGSACNITFDKTCGSHCVQSNAGLCN